MPPKRRSGTRSLSGFRSVETGPQLQPHGRGLARSELVAELNPERAESPLTLLTGDVEAHRHVVGIHGAQSSNLGVPALRDKRRHDDVDDQRQQGQHHPDPHALIELDARSARHPTPKNRGLLPGSPTTTRTGLPLADLIQLSGRNTPAAYALGQEPTRQPASPPSRRPARWSRQVDAAALDFRGEKISEHHADAEGCTWHRAGAERCRHRGRGPATRARVPRFVSPSASLLWRSSLTESGSPLEGDRERTSTNVGERPPPL